MTSTGGATPDSPGTSPAASAVERLRARHRTARHEPPVWSPERMRATALRLGVVLLVVAATMVWLLTRSISDQKVNQKAERLMTDLLAATATINDRIAREGAPFVPAADGSLPPEYVEHFATMRGGQPYYRETGRYSRLDVFSPVKPYGEPLAYHVRESNWLLVSRGPDGTFDVGTGFLAENLSPADIRNRLAPLTYDPTNGVQSRGDVWTSNLPK